MAEIVFEQRANDRLSAAVAEAATTLYLADASEFSSTYMTPPFLIMVDPGNDAEECMLVTSVDTVAKTLTVERDMLGTSDVAHAKDSLVVECGNQGTLSFHYVDISTAESVYFVPPKCVITRIKSCLEGTIAAANATITCSKGAQAITNGKITIAYDGSAAGDVDIVYPTAYTEFNGTTDTLLCAGGGESTNGVSVGVVIEYMTI